MSTYTNNRETIHKGLTGSMIVSPINMVIPKPSGWPVPIPNIAHAPGLKNGTATLTIRGNSVSVEGSRFESHPTTPDRIGGIKGVKSTVVGGAAEPTSYSSNTKFEGKGSVRAFDMTKSNSLVIQPGFAQRMAMKLLPGPYDKIASKVIEKLPGAFNDQLKALGDSITDPSVLIGPALKLVGKLIPGVNLIVGGAAMAQSAAEMAELAAQVKEMLTPPLTDEKIDEIADLIANTIASITIGFVLGKAAKFAKKAVAGVAKRANNMVNPNSVGPIGGGVGAGGGGPPSCELGSCKPVIFATGVKIMNEVDFVLPGLIDLEWKRFYRSSDRRMGWLGFGWSTSLSAELALTYENIIFYDERGRAVTLPHVAHGQSHFDQKEKFTLSRATLDDRSNPSGYRIEFTDGGTFTFTAPKKGQWRLPLAQRSDRNGNSIDLTYPANYAVGVDGLPPRPTSLVDSAGRVLRFTWTNDTPTALLLNVALESRTLDGRHLEAQQLVAYRFSTNGNEEGDTQANLVSATDALGQANGYAYKVHLMVNYTTKTGFRHHQQWSRYDAGGRVVRSWTDQPGLLDTRFEYDLAHRQTRVTDAIGRTTTYCYTTNHEVTRIIEADGSVTSAPVDAAGNPTASTDALGRSTQYQFDERGNLTGITDATGATTKIVYSALGATSDAPSAALPPDLPIRHIDALGNEFTSEYDRWGNLIVMHAPLLERAQLQKLSSNKASRQAASDADADTPTPTQTPTHATTRYTYDARGLPASITDANGGVKRLRWDDAGQLTAYTDCSDRTTRYEYDALGNISAITDALGQRTLYVHDALGQLRMVTQPDGGSHHYHYDGSGNLSSYTDPLGASTSYRYNGIDLPVERIDATGAKLNYVYDDMGRLIVLQNENRAHYRFFYDIVDNLIEEIGFDCRVQRYGYNPAGELTHLIEAGGSDAGPGKLTWFERDALGRLTRKQHSHSSHSSHSTPPHGPVDASDDAAADISPTTFTYDALGRMVACANADATVAFAYNPLSWLTAETQTHHGSALAPFTLRHHYDPLGNRTTTELPGPEGRVNKRLHWLYYGSGHLHQINIAERHASDGPSGEAWHHHTLVDMERDALHREIERSQGAVTSHYGIDPMGRLTAHKISRNSTVAHSRARAQNNSADTLGRVSLPHLQGETTLPNAERIKRSYGYDDAGNLTGVTDALRGKSTYQYDALSRIRAAERAGANAAVNPTNERFDFDPAGNLLNANAGAGNAQSSGGVSSNQIYNNRIAVFQDLRFAYDEHGNVIERLEGWHTQQHFSYSAEHQLTSATVTRFAEKPDKPDKRNAVNIDDTTPRPATVQTTHYRYDPLGRRIDKTDTFGSTTFIYDGDLLIGELRGSKLSEYIYEPDSFVPLAKLESQWGGAPETSDEASNKGEKKQQSKPKLALVQTQASDAARIAPAQAVRAETTHTVRTELVEVPHEAEQKSYAVYYYQCDQIGAPQELTDEHGRIVWAASYKVWGETEALQFLKTGTGGSADAFEVFAPSNGGNSSSNSNRSKPKLSLADASRAQTLNLVDQPLRFQGQYFDQETGLHYNRFRYYDPVTGRFIHQDPIGLYGAFNFYAYPDDPFGDSDPLGLAPTIRGKLYPSRVRKGTKKSLDKGATGQDGVMRCAKCNCAIMPSDASVQHEPPLVDSHNTKGFDMDQKGRNDLYNSTAKSINCLPCQKAEGGSMSHQKQYRSDTGPNFKPRAPRKKKAGGSGGCP